MARKDLNKFFISIVLPSILAIGLFIISIFVLIIPSFERNIMDKKKEMISELTNTVWSLIEEFDKEYQSQNFTLSEAKELAASRIEQIRYGDEYKDYFWIIDLHPTMIMHPYRPELIDSDLTDYEDPNGKKLFVEATKIVAKDGEGFIDYMWQWKDDSSRIVPKLSYVREYEPWGWIVGTGIYLEDVKQEMGVMKQRLIGISLFISITITVILLFVIRQSLKIENKRKAAETELLLSQQKYKSLVEASTEGTLMMLNQNIIFSNLKLNELSGYDSLEVLSLQLEDIFDLSWEQVVNSFDTPGKSLTIESILKTKSGSVKEVILSVSEISYAEDDSYIIIAKEISQQEQIEKETEYLSQELQTSLLMMNQSISPLISDMVKSSIDTSIQQAAVLMSRKKRDILFIQRNKEIVGVVNDADLKKRVLAENIDPNTPILQVMTSPVISIAHNALLYEAILLFNKKKISHLATRNEDGSIEGVISYLDIMGMQQNSVSYLIKEIDIAEDVDSLLKIHNRVPVLVNALIESGDKTQNITRIITSISDAITSRIISLTIEDLGEPPCQFAFIVMGSEGRMEQTLSTDQDNAIVFEDLEGVKLDEAYGYFKGFGSKVCLDLHQVGYKLCDGEIMASNPKWSQPITTWKNYFSEWIISGDPQSILDACIFFDFRFVYGQMSFIKELRNHVNLAVDNKSVFFYHLAQSVVKYKSPVSLFGKIIDKNHSGDKVLLDIKKVLLPINGFIRLYAIYHKLNETNSLSRIKQLYLQGVINKSMYEELVLSYNYLMHIRFRSQSKSILENKLPDNIIDINKLTHIEVSTIKKIFGEIGNLQTKLNFDFKGSM